MLPMKSSFCFRGMACCLLAFLGAINLGAQIIYINFGSNVVSTPGWNSTTLKQTVSGWQDLAVIPVALVDSTGADSGVFMTPTLPYWDSNDGGYAGGAVGDFVAEATATTLYHQVGGSVTGTRPLYEFSGLNPTSTYTFEVFGSRAGGTTRSAIYIFTGTNSGSDELNASFNSSQTAIVAGISPTSGGVISFESDFGSDSDSGWHYINAMKITEVAGSAVPEPSTYALLLGVGVCGFLVLRRRNRSKSQ